MSFFKKLFGGGSSDVSAEAPAGKAKRQIEHEGYVIKATPYKEQGQWQTCGVVAKTVEGALKEHRFVRADRFGSGWVWLVVNDARELQITSTPSQDNPLMDVAEVKGQPLLGNDVWEHAYYLAYNNRRAEYLSTWWDVVDWGQVSENYADALAAQ